MYTLFGFIILINIILLIEIVLFFLVGNGLKFWPYLFSVSNIIGLANRAILGVDIVFGVIYISYLIGTLL